MTIRTCVGVLGCTALLLLCSLSACSSLSESVSEPTVTTTTTTKLVTTTALPSVGYIHNHATLIRSGAGLAYKAVCGIEAGEQVTIVGRNGDWYEVQYQGLSGYISGQFLRFTPWDPNTTTAAAVTTATTGTVVSDTTVATTTGTH